MSFERLFILVLMPMSFACSKLDESMIAVSGDATRNFITPGPNNTDGGSRCEIPTDLYPENADSDSLRMTLKINGDEFQFDGTPNTSNGVFKFFVNDFITDTDLGIFFDINAAHDFPNQDVSLFGNVLIRNDSNETQNVSLEFKIPVISDGTQNTSYSGSVSMVLSNGEIMAIDNQSLWTQFSGCNLFSKNALSLSEAITAGSNQFVNIGSYAFGGGNSPNIEGENIVKEIGFRLRFSLSAGAFVSLTSTAMAHRESDI